MWDLNLNAAATSPKISKASWLIEDIHDVKWSVVSVKSREPTIPEHQLIIVSISLVSAFKAASAFLLFVTCKPLCNPAPLVLSLVLTLMSQTGKQEYLTELYLLWL